ncbi:PilZ domain-containing protein [Vibrio gallaecicus]|uniref:PilZ domain-containing protein n=1 Tax=Vibrio TaxID=662 RepID=UPI0010C9FAE8|nr:PilZ domain-containing protein [Vibrio gallaecicus]MDN3617676.1 PilZ domain-containing protein [Vibrio gallaecicus]
MNSTTDKKNDLSRYLKSGIRAAAVINFGPNDSIPVNGIYIGCKQEQYLIIELSQKSVESLTLRKLNNVDIVVRAVTDTELGHIVAFKTSILSSISKPAHLLFLRPPTNYASKPIREHERYKIDLECQVHFGTLLFDATILDFSVSGCGLYFSEQSDIENGIKLKVQSALSAHLPDELVYQVVSKKKHNKGWLIGVQFKEPVEMNENLKKELLEQAFLSGSL